MAGAFSQDVVVATAYATLGVDAVVKAVVQGGVSVLMCNRKAVPQVLKLVSSMKSLKAIVYSDVLNTPEECTESLSAPASGGKPQVISFDEVNHPSALPDVSPHDPLSSLTHSPLSTPHPLHPSPLHPSLGFSPRPAHRSPCPTLRHTSRPTLRPTPNVAPPHASPRPTPM